MCGQQMCYVCVYTHAQRQRTLTLKVVHREDTGMIESCFANALIGSKHES